MSTVHFRPAARPARGVYSGIPLLAGMALLALSPALACAQEAAPAAAGESRTDLGASVRATYDSNVSRSDATFAAQRGLVQQDYIVEPSLNFDLARPVGRQSVFLTGAVGYDFYNRNHIFNRERLDVTTGAALQAAGCHATVSVNYIRQQSQLQDLELFGALDNLESDQVYRVSADCARQIGFSPTGSVSETIADNSLDLQRNADHHTLSATAGLLYSNPGLGRLQVFGGYDATEYPNRIVNLAGQTDGYQAFSGGVSYERHVGARLDATLQATFMHLRPDVANEPGFDGLTYKADIALRLGARMQLTGDVSQGAVPANRIGVSFDRQTSAQIGLNYAATRRLSFGVGGFVQDHHYEGVALDPAFFVTRERVSGLFGSSELKLGRRLSLLLDCRWQKQTADIPVFSYDDVRVSLTASTRF
jgi:hypothetical protein